MSPLMESMESRRLLSVSFDPSAHVVAVTGEPGPDTVYATVHDGVLQVTQNDLTYAFPAGSVSKLTIDLTDDVGTDGSNLVGVDASVFAATEIKGGRANDILQGGSGPDAIWVRGFRSYATGGAGNDTFYVYDGGEITVDGGAGNDTVVMKSADAAANLIAGGGGYDTVDYGAFAPGIVLRNGATGRYVPDAAGRPTANVADPGAADQLSGFESLYGGKGNDLVVGTGGANYLRGNGGNDILRGGGGDDSLDGGPGADTLYGEDGDDSFFAVDGTADALYGGAGTDTAKHDAADVLDSVEG